MEPARAVGAFLFAALLTWIAVVALDDVQSEPVQTKPLQLYVDVPPDATLLRMDKRALEEAYHQQLLKLFSVWLADRQGGDPTFISAGLRHTRRAYNQAAQQIARREQELLEQDRQRQDEKR